MSEAAVQSIEFPALRNRNYPIHKAADRLEPYLRAIVEKIHPEKIILFGSFAYGEPTRHSDFDLMVIRKDFTNSRDSNVQIRMSTVEVDAAPESFTILSCTPEDYERRVSMGEFIYREISEKGVPVYEV
jgi:predicted nucleotidyltransferase